MTADEREYLEDVARVTASLDRPGTRVLHHVG